jgi:hypothetical protein
MMPALGRATGASSFVARERKCANANANADADDADAV